MLVERKLAFASECSPYANVPEPESLRRASLTDPNDPVGRRRAP